MRFIPTGHLYEVPRVLIHVICCILWRRALWLYILSIAMMVMSARVCPSPLKSSATGDSSVFPCVMLKRWPLILRCSGCPVSPTYCWPHLQQVTFFYMQSPLSLCCLLFFDLFTSFSFPFISSDPTSNTISLSVLLFCGHFTLLH